jgi:hypothetical protein
MIISLQNPFEKLNNDVLKRDERITCPVIVLASSSTIYKHSTNPNQVKITYDHQELDMV